VAQALQAARHPFALGRRLEHDPPPGPRAEHGGETRGLGADPLLEQLASLRQDADLPFLLVHVNANMLHGWPPSPCARERVIAVGQSMPPRRVGGQPLHPIYNLQRLNQAIIDQGLADDKFTLRITGGDRFVDSKGKARSLSDFTYVDDSAPNSGHLIQNGGRAADLAQGGVSDKVFDRALQETAFDPKLTRRQEYIKHPHTHIELPNKAPFNPAPASIPDMYGRKDRP
jgi:hypothetical protein